MGRNNVRLPKVTIELDKPRVLCFDLNAFCMMEEKFGSVQDGLQALRTQQVKALRTLLWLSLQHEHEDEGLTEQDVGRMLGWANLGEVVNALAKALGMSLPEVDDEKNSQNPA